MTIQALGPNTAAVSFRSSSSSNNISALKAEKSAVPTLLREEAKMVKPSLATRIAKKAIIFGLGALSIIKLSSCQKENVTPTEKPITSTLSDGEKATNKIFGIFVNDTSLTTENKTIDAFEYYDNGSGYTHKLTFKNDTLFDKVIDTDGSDLDYRREIISKTGNPNKFNSKEAELIDGVWVDRPRTAAYEIQDVGGKTALVKILNNKASLQYTQQSVQAINVHDLTVTKPDWLLTIKNLVLKSAKVIR